MNIDRYEDDGTDRKKKGRKEEGREERKGVLRRVISSKILVSDCSYCVITLTDMLTAIYYYSGILAECFTQ